MKAEQHISFLADLLNLINELDTLVKDYCRYLTTDQDGSCLEKTAFRGGRGKLDKLLSGKSATRNALRWA